MNTKIDQELRDAIVKKCPEIMSVTEGFRILIPESFQVEVDEFEDQEGTIIGWGNHMKLVSRSQYPKGTVTLHVEPITHDEISALPAEHLLGRPITLADVLRAMEPTPGTRLDGPGGYWEQRHNLLVYWNLAIPSLEDQSEECKAFLHSIICSK